MDSFIIPNVKYSPSDIPSKAFFRGTQKLSIKVDDEGLTFNGKSVNWSDITGVKVKFFNCNPYLQLASSSGESFNFFFENKFYYRKKAPWYGASEFITTSFVKALEEKNLFTVDKLKANVGENITTPTMHKLWNLSFFVVPVILIIVSVIVLYVGLVQNSQIQLL